MFDFLTFLLGALAGGLIIGIILLIFVMWATAQAYSMGYNDKANGRDSYHMESEES